MKSNLHKRETKHTCHFQFTLQFGTVNKDYVMLWP